MLIGIDASRAVTTRRTGTEAYAYFLIHSLIPLAVQAGHRVSLYVNQPASAGIFPQSPAVELVTIPFRRLWTHLRLGAELHRRPPDVFFTPSHVLPVSYYGRSIATVHDLAYHHFPEAYTWQQRAYLRWSTRHNSRRSRIILADSAATKQDLIHFYGTDPAKIEVVYPGIDPLLKPVRDEAQITAVCQKYSITPPYLLTIGTLQPRKNLVRLINAFTHANLPHQLVLAGSPGWLSQPIVDAVKLSIVNRQSSIVNQPALSVPKGQSSIILPGFVDDADKPALISGATALLYPSLYEGFGFPVLEGHACETAVLCANTSSLPEVAGDAALFVDPHDTAAMTTAIQRIARDDALRTDLIQRGIQNVKRFSWEETAVNTLTLLEKAAV